MHDPCLYGYINSQHRIYLVIFLMGHLQKVDRRYMPEGLSKLIFLPRPSNASSQDLKDQEW